MIGIEKEGERERGMEKEREREGEKERERNIKARGSAQTSQKRTEGPSVMM